MKWVRIRQHYQRLFNATGLTQVQVAIAGGLGATNNNISRLLSNANQGPATEIFVKAVLGLGMPVSEFFRQLEQGEFAARPGPSHPDQAVMVQTLIDGLQSMIASLERLQAK